MYIIENFISLAIFFHIIAKNNFLKNKNFFGHSLKYTVNVEYSIKNLKFSPNLTSHPSKDQMPIEYGNWQIADDEFGLEAKFFAQMPSGAMMDDFAGIWALGMDLLLSAMEKGQIDFYVYRSCNCSMNAWVN
jgi:hypothetical protein